MRIRVLLFAALREAVGEKELFLEVPDGASLQELLTELESTHPQVGPFRDHVLVSVNRE
jgi:molybdopterin converting factor small subunit